MEISFAGYQITDVFRVRDVKRSILPPRTNYSVDIPSRHGQYYTGFKYNPRIIEVEIIIINDDLNSQIRNLAWMLDLPNPSQLIISDEPNKVYYAVLDDTDFDSILHVGQGTLKFLCLDPFAYSTLEKTYSADTNGKLTLINGGTAPTEPIFEIDFLSSASFVALVSPQGVIQIGQPKEVDVTATPQSEVLVNDGMSATTNWVTNAPTSKIRTTGAVMQGSVMSNNYNIRPNSYGTNVLNKWFGMTIKHDLKTSRDGTNSAQYWEFSATFKFSADDYFGANPVEKQIGRLEFNILDEAGNFLAGFTMRDSYEAYHWAVPEFHVGTQRIFQDEPAIPPPTTVTQYNPTTQKYETKTIQPTTLGKWNNFFGKIIIRRTLDTFYFELQKLEAIDPAGDETTDPVRIVTRLSKTYYDTSQIYSNLKARSINCWFGKYSDKPFIGLNYIDHVYFKKNYVEDWHDVPNIFNDGDRLRIDCQKSQVYLNNELFMQKLDVGSQFFSLVEGETEIQLLHNSAIQPPYTCTIVEKFL